MIFFKIILQTCPDGKAQKLKPQIKCFLFYICNKQYIWYIRSTLHFSFPPNCTVGSYCHHYHNLHLLKERKKKEKKTAMPCIAILCYTWLIMWNSQFINTKSDKTFKRPYNLNRRTNWATAIPTLFQSLSRFFSFNITVVSCCNFQKFKLTTQIGELV